MTLAPAPPAFRPNPILKWIRTHLMERTLQSLPKTDRVLDLCCGYGFYFTINPNAHGVDGGPESVRELQGNGFKVQQADVLKSLPYLSEQFSYVVAHDVLEHFHYEDLKRLLREVHRVLEPGGSFLVFVPNRKGYNYGLDIGAGHQLFVTATEIERLREGLFELRRNFSEPLPRRVGQWFVHNKEVFELIKV